MKSYGPAPFSFTATTVRASLEGGIDTVTVCGDSADTGTAEKTLTKLVGPLPNSFILSDE
jgi:hypothetical protein